MTAIGGLLYFLNDLFRAANRSGAVVIRNAISPLSDDRVNHQLHVKYKSSPQNCYYSQRNDEGNAGSPPI